MKYDTTGMDVAYVQSLYPNESPEVIIKAMIFVRENGYPKKIGIIAWFDFILHIMRDIVRLHATKQENAESIKPLSAFVFLRLQRQLLFFYLNLQKITPNLLALIAPRKEK